VPYIPGSPIEAYCTECKSDTDHRVLEVDGKLVRAVRCEKCSNEGILRAPRDKTKAALIDYAKRSSAPPPPRKNTRSKKVVPPEETFRELTEHLELDTATTYNIKKPLAEGDLIDHPSFGVGLVTMVTDLHKAKVFFETGERVMVCNRK
jgi:hypothetical protein